MIFGAGMMMARVKLSLSSTLLNGLTAYYKFDGNSNDSVGTYNGTDLNVSYVAGLNGNAASYNGSSSRTTIPGIILGTNFSISCWVKPIVWTSWGTILAQNSSLGFFIKSTGLTYYYSGDHLSTTKPSLGVYSHVVMTYASGAVKFYINGTLDATTLSGAPTFTANYIGGDNGNDWLNGILDEMGVWTRVLSGAEIIELYNSGAGRYYPFS